MIGVGSLDVTWHVLALVIVFPVLTAVLAFARIIIGDGSARVYSAIALLLAAIPLVIIFSQLEQDSLGLRYVQALEALSRQIGWLAFVVPISIPLAVSALFARPGSRWIDWVHGLALLILVLLWLLGL